MIFRDYYAILGLAAGAGADEIKGAYRKLARKFHPDVSKAPGTEKRFTEIGEAYEVLQDAEKRAAYDRLRAGGWRDGQEIDPPRSEPQFRRHEGPAGGEAEQFSDFFQALFGGRQPMGRRAGPQPHEAFQHRGEDIHHPLTVTLDESFRGGERQLTFHAEEMDGSSGMRSVSVKIPKGVIAGTGIRLRGQGHPGSSPELHGDLYLDVELAPHSRYTVSGRDLTLRVPIAPWEAVLGAKIAVPTLDGSVTATIPAGSQQGGRLRLKGRGLPGEPPGDQYLELSIVVPPAATDAVKALYRDLAVASSYDPRAGLGF